MREVVLGVKVDNLSPAEAVEKISDQVSRGKNLMQVVTAYSEFFVTASKDPQFKKVLGNADLVLPDGVGPLSALDYFRHLKASDGLLTKIARGVGTGLRVLRGQVGQPVSGVWLFQTLTELAAKNGWRTFLLGGFGDTSYRLAAKMQNNHPDLVVTADQGEQQLGTDPSEAKRVLETINRFKPDILFVAYGPIGQEKWIAENKKKLFAKVAIGMGGTFNELLGSEKSCPKAWQRIGLKWLWRLLWQPWRWRRILDAYPIFPLMVFNQSLHQKGQ